MAIGLQNKNVFTRIYESYLEANKRRNEFIARHIDETLKADEVGIIFMREGHQVQFIPDIEVFYISPTALDELNRWIREHKTKSQ